MVTETFPTPASTAIVAAFGASRRCAETLEMAAALAKHAGANLEVVYVEDANLLRLADLPGTHEVDRLSGITRGIDRARMMRALSCEVRQLKNELARVTKATSLRPTVRVVRGQVLSEALAASVGVDVTFVHAARRMLSGERLPGAFMSRDPAPSAWRQGRRPRNRRSVWTLFEGDSAGIRTIELASRMAHTLECGLMVLLACRGGEQAAARKREARAAAGLTDLEFVEVAEKGSLLQSRMLAPGAGSLLVLAKQSRELEDRATRDYLESLCVPLVLVA